MTALRLAHRGDWRVAPENSLEAMRAALQGPACQGLEFDVRVSADGVPIVLHDRTLDRVQGVDADASRLTAAELRTHGVPTLEDVLAVATPMAFLDIEFKAVVPAALPLIDAARGGSRRGRDSRLLQTVVSSFEPAILEWLGQERPKWPRWLNVEVPITDGLVAEAVRLRVAGISADWHFIDERAAARVRDAGLALAAWTVRRRSTYERLEQLGVVAICAEAAALDG